MPDLYNFHVEKNGEQIDFGLSSVDTGNADRLFRMWTIQVEALEVVNDV